MPRKFSELAGRRPGINGLDWLKAKGYKIGVIGFSAGGHDAAELEEPFGALVAAVFLGTLNDGGDKPVAGFADLGESVGQGIFG